MRPRWKSFAWLLTALSLHAQTPATTPDGFAVARPGYRFSFPKDHGSHPAFRTEWWYVTGHLWTADKHQRFGYQLTFFRQASPKADWTGSESWRSDQILLAHGAITDVQGRSFKMEERLNRQGLAAGAQEGKLLVFNEGWKLEQRSDGKLSLRVRVKKSTLELTLDPRTPPVIFGEDGVSRKGEDPTAASHYITFPKLRSSGTLTIGKDDPLPVSGWSWMDHEFSSNQLDENQVGWDWAGIQLKDGRCLMAYRMRLREGDQDAFSTITEVGQDGRITRKTHAFRMTPLGTWNSPTSATRYPLPLQIEAWGEVFTLKPILMAQELRTGRSTGITYWEGACQVFNASGEEIGDAYLELTGYAHSLKGRF